MKWSGGGAYCKYVNRSTKIIIVLNTHIVTLLTFGLAVTGIGCVCGHVWCSVIVWSSLWLFHYIYLFEIAALFAFGVGKLLKHKCSIHYIWNENRGLKTSRDSLKTSWDWPQYMSRLISRRCMVSRHLETWSEDCIKTVLRRLETVSILIKD